MILQRTGAFKFRTVDTADDKKEKISAIFAESEADDHHSAAANQARKLAAIWTPTEGSLLNSIILQPAQAGRALADRLSPTNQSAFKLIGHPLTDVHSEILKPLAETKTIAYERDSEIHLVTDVSPILDNWDADASVAGGCEIITLLEALLLHELVELVVRESTPDLDPLICHMIASTFERYLKNSSLSVAVEDFFLNWPQLSSAEMEERRNAELEEQVQAASAFLGEEDVPEDDDDDLDDLPMDTGRPVKLKKKVVKKKAEAGKSSGKVGKKKVVKKKKKRPSS